VQPPAVRRLFDIQPWKEPAYALFAIAVFFGYMGLYVPYFYLQLNSLETGTVIGGLNFYLLPIMNAAGLFGRLVRLRPRGHLRS
jgi:hypothetical protein